MTHDSHHGKPVVITTEGELSKAGCLVVNEANEILVVIHKDKSVALPKGHVEIGESLEQVAMREVQEETGYTVQLSDRLPDFTYSNRETGQGIRVAFWRATASKRVHEGEDPNMWLSVEDTIVRMKPNAAEYLRSVIEPA